MAKTGFSPENGYFTLDEKQLLNCHSNKCSHIIPLESVPTGQGCNLKKERYDLTKLVGRLPIKIPTEQPINVTLERIDKTVNLLLGIKIKNPEVLSTIPIDYPEKFPDLVTALPQQLQMSKSSHSSERVKSEKQRRRSQKN